ncbi:MAG: PhnD/SsuA/transferrin family substrate-binding protein [Planctomycetaceae bacterium]|nr:PhnD/SsuA/transferrin family substrate-binding protein [Planctomycetaceae bacterium]
MMPGIRDLYPAGLQAAVLCACLSTGVLGQQSADSSAATDATSAGSTSDSLLMVVMDPLAGPLSCPCVEGYAQRKYEVLAGELQQELGSSVRVVFAESLKLAVEKAGRQPDFIVGKDSVVRADGVREKMKLSPVLRLTDRDGRTTQRGLIVVNRDDPARSVADLDGYTIIFGKPDADEKHAAAIRLLKENGVAVPQKLTIDEACSDGACKVIELGKDSHTAAVISSYARPLLEGCGTVKKGDLRVVGETAEVPFVTVFFSDRMAAAKQEQVRQKLMLVSVRPTVLEAMESLLGFLTVPAAADETTAVGNVISGVSQTRPAKKN